MENIELIRLLNKDFVMDIAEKLSFTAIHSQLAAYINELVKNDFDKLITYLYRIDVNEHKLKTWLQQNPQDDAGNIIATLIIERQQQKIKTREQFSKPQDDLQAGQSGFDKEEKW